MARIKCNKGLGQLSSNNGEQDNYLLLKSMPLQNVNLLQNISFYVYVFKLFKREC